MRDIDKFTDENFSRELLHAIAADEGRCFDRSYRCSRPVMWRF